MNVLFTSSGNDTGSWQIRGEQIAAALNSGVKDGAPLIYARAQRHATLEECRAADVIVVVKRISADLLYRIKVSGRPWVCDIVDAYPQKSGAHVWDREQSIVWLMGTLSILRPNYVIWPTARMRDDYVDNGGTTEGETIYHHHRPGIEINPIRPAIKKIGYEGRELYLGEWEKVIENVCVARGLEFVKNPRQLADVDVVLALRSDEWFGYPQRHWKSNVKLANAHGSGTPFIGMAEDGYLETCSGIGAEYFINNSANKFNELSIYLDNMEDRSMRGDIANEFFRSAITLEEVCAMYEKILCAVK